MNPAPVITVLLPVYNGAAHLRAAMDSVLHQSFTEIELLVVNDGSTDESAAIVAGCSDPRVRVIHLPTNQGLIAALNHGIQAARGAYIARMDADDLMDPSRLARLVDLMNADPGIAAAATGIRFINNDGEVTGGWPMDAATDTEPRLRAMLARTNCIASIMIRRSLLERLRYDPRQTGVEDWDLLMRLMSKGHRIVKIQDTLYDYRIHPQSIMGRSKQEAPVELRLLRARARYLLGDWSRGIFKRFHLRVLVAQGRSFARHLKLNVLPPIARSTYRILTYSPLKLLHEHRQLRNALASWNGRELFLFPYLHRGGAEQVHGDILQAIGDQQPLAIITGFSTGRSNAARFRDAAVVVEAPRLLNHPFTRKAAEESIARKLNAVDKPVLFSSLTTTFFDLLPQLKPEVRAIWLQHAFRYQADGNLQHRAWLSQFARVANYVFVSQHARSEFEKFLFANNVPRSAFSKLLYLPNAVHQFGTVIAHERIGLLFVGRDSPEKRLRIFLRLAKELHAALPGRFRCTVVGPSRRDSIEGVTFTGPIDDPGALQKIYADHDILCVTSDREGFPMVIMEAMAQGLAIMSTPVGDVPQRLDTRTALITTGTEEEVVVREMVGSAIALANDPQKLHTMRTDALDKARREFDMDAFRRRYRELLISPAAVA